VGCPRGRGPSITSDWHSDLFEVGSQVGSQEYLNTRTALWPQLQHLPEPNSTATAYHGHGETTLPSLHRLGIFSDTFLMI